MEICVILFTVSLIPSASPERPGGAWVVGQHDGERLRGAQTQPEAGTRSAPASATPERNGKSAYVAVAIKSDPVSTPASVKRLASSRISRRTTNAAAA